MCWYRKCHYRMCHCFHEWQTHIIILCVKLKVKTQTQQAASLREQEFTITNQASSINIQIAKVVQVLPHFAQSSVFLLIHCWTVNEKNKAATKQCSVPCSYNSPQSIHLQQHWQHKSSEVIWSLCLRFLSQAYLNTVSFYTSNMLYHFKIGIAACCGLTR